MSLAGCHAIHVKKLAVKGVEVVRRCEWVGQLWSLFPRYQLTEPRSSVLSLCIYRHRHPLHVVFFNRPPLPHPHHRRHHCILILSRLSRCSLTFRMRCSFLKTSRGEAWLKSNLWYPLKMCVCCAAVWVGCLGPPIVKEPKVLRVLEREIRESAHTHTQTHTTHTCTHTSTQHGGVSATSWWVQWQGVVRVVVWTCRS